MSYLDTGASILDWFPHRPANTKLHPLPTMWLTPLKGFGLVPPLSKRARLLSDDVEMEGAIPAVFPRSGDSTSRFEAPASCDVERATPTPPVSPGSNRASMTALSAGCSPQRPVSGSPRRPASPHALLLARAATAAHSASESPSQAVGVPANPNPFPKPSGLLKAGLVPTPPGTPKRRARAGFSAPTVDQPPVAPAADAEAMARALSPLQPRVWSPMNPRKAVPADPLADWGYTNPKPPSPNMPAGLQMDVAAFPSFAAYPAGGARAAVAVAVAASREMAVATTPPKSEICKVASAGPAVPVFGQPMSPAQRARAKLMLEGKIVRSSGEASPAPAPAPVAMAMIDTITISIPTPPADGDGPATSGVNAARWQSGCHGGGWVVGGGLVGVAVVGCAATGAAVTETDPETDHDDDYACDTNTNTNADTDTDTDRSKTHTERSGQDAASTTSAGHGACAYQLPGLAAGSGSGTTASADPELGDGIAMFDWEYSLPPAATDAAVPQNPRASDLRGLPASAPNTVDGYGCGRGYGYGYGGVYGPAVPAVPAPAPAFTHHQHTRVEETAAAASSGMVSPPEDDAEETAWGCRVPDTDHYGVSTTSLGWDGCYYGYGGGGGTLSDTMSDSDSDRASSPTALEAAVSAVTVRGDANLRMGVIYDLV